MQWGIFYENNSSEQDISFLYRPGPWGIRQNITRSDDITEGNISPNPPNGGSINDIILYRNLKNPLS